MDKSVAFFGTGAGAFAGKATSAWIVLLVSNLLAMTPVGPLPPEVQGEWSGALTAIIAMGVLQLFHMWSKRNAAPDQPAPLPPFSQSGGNAAPVPPTPVTETKP